MARPSRGPEGVSLPREMPEPIDHTLVAGLLTSLAARTQAETVVLTARLRETCWPGSDDRTDVLAREWLRLRGPSLTSPSLASCTCGDGRCRVCN
jgi:hypothetical protein